MVRGGGAAVGPMAAGACVCCAPPLPGVGGCEGWPGFCAHTPTASRQIRRRPRAGSLKGFLGMNQAILVETSLCGDSCPQLSGRAQLASARPASRFRKLKSVRLRLLPAHPPRVVLEQILQVGIIQGIGLALTIRIYAHAVEW